MQISNEFNKYDSNEFKCSNNNKTIKKITNGEFKGVYLKNRVVFNDTINEFHFKLYSPFSSFFFNLGFAISGLNQDTGLSTKKQTWYFSLFNGNFFNNNVVKEYDCNVFLCLQNNNIITLCFDTKNNVVFLKLNGKDYLEKHKIELESYQQSKLYPFLDLRNNGDIATILPVLPNFDLNDTLIYYQDDYDISEDNSHIKKNNYGFSQVYFKNRILFDDSIKEYSFKIKNAITSSIILGFFVLDNGKIDSFDKKQNWYINLYTQNYSFAEGKTVTITNNGSLPKPGDIVTLCFDTKSFNYI